MISVILQPVGLLFWGLNMWPLCKQIRLITTNLKVWQQHYGFADTQIYQSFSLKSCIFPRASQKNLFDLFCLVFIQTGKYVKFMLLYFINNDLWQKRYGCWRHTDLAKLWTLAFFLVLIWISICIQTEKYYILHLYKYNIYIYNLFIVHWNKNGF